MSCIALQWIQQGALWLFDCGEGAQHQILRAPGVRLSQLEHVWVTHLHGDHVFGLPGLLASRSLAASAEAPVAVHGPQGIAELLAANLNVTHTNLRYPCTAEAVQEGIVLADSKCRVICRLLSHGVPSFGYAIQEADSPGEFDAAQAAALGIPAGPLYGRLKNGEAITLADGRVIDGRDLVGPTQPGRKVVICGDTGPTSAVAELARGADVLVHEATFLREDLERARLAGHSTSEDAAKAARDAGAAMLILTHFSPRYESDKESRLPALLAEAQAIFPNTHLAADYWCYEVPRRS